MLFLPGLTQSISEFRQLTAALRRKFRVIAADLPGSGKSGPQPRDYTPAYYENDARAFLALLRKLNATPAHLVGFSDGGEVELLMAVRDPSAVRSVAAWGAAGEISASAETLETFYNLIDAPIEPLQDFSASLKSTYGEMNARLMVRGAVTAWRGILADGGSISRSEAGSIHCPTLLIVGEDDQLCLPQSVSALARSIPRGEFIEVKDEGHALHIRRGEWLVSTMLDWLAQKDR